MDPHSQCLEQSAQTLGSAESSERLFTRSVEQCVAAGLVDGSKLYLDASLVAANAYTATQSSRWWFGAR